MNVGCKGSMGALSTPMYIGCRIWSWKGSGVKALWKGFLAMGFEFDV